MLLDTNVVIGHLDGEPTIVASMAEFKSRLETFVISIVTVTEVLSHEKLSSEDVIRIKEYLETLLVLPLDFRTAEVAAEFRRKYRLITPDALIVATAYVNGIPLATRDQKMRKV